MAVINKNITILDTGSAFIKKVIPQLGKTLIYFEMDKPTTMDTARFTDFTTILWADVMTADSREDVLISTTTANMITLQGPNTGSAKGLVLVEV